jgi:hypothetical protein
MPAIVGAFKVVSVGGVLQTGDAAYIVPKTVSKTYTGSGAFNTGDVPRTMSILNSTNTNDQDVNDVNQRTAF